MSADIRTVSLLLRNRPQPAQKELPAAWIVWVLAENPANRDALAALPGCLPALVRLLGSADEDVQLQQEAAAGTLGCLSLDCPERKAAIAAVPGCLPTLVKLLDSGNEAVQTTVARLIWSLAAGHPANRAAIAAVPGSLAALSWLLDNVSAAVREAADGALHELAQEEEAGCSSLSPLLESSPAQPTPVPATPGLFHAREWLPDHCALCCAPASESEMVVLNPCGHRCACEGCAARLQVSEHSQRRCPVCRTKITSLLRLYADDEE